MRGVRLLAGVLVFALAASGCASQTAHNAAESGKKLAFAQEFRRSGSGLSTPVPIDGLAGRTIRVHSISDIRLGPKEVVLTFDDGPMPGKTGKILDILRHYGVRATFLMVGQMAQAYPATVREVAAAGHSIGSHTQDHRDLSHMSLSAAMGQIKAGRRSIAAALGPSVYRQARFFRFPYLASTPALRRQLALQNIVVIDPDIDSKDYFQSTPEQVKQRTLARLGSRGSGIILFHDIHARTVAMLPGFLADLKARGFHVVHLAPPLRSRNPLIASLDVDEMPTASIGR